MSSRASPAPACRMRGIIVGEPPGAVEGRSLTRPAPVLTFVLSKLANASLTCSAGYHRRAGLLSEAAGSCVQIDGGAVEVSWVVHANGRAITDCTCSNPEIASVRIDIVGTRRQHRGHARPAPGRPSVCSPASVRRARRHSTSPRRTATRLYPIPVVAVDKDGADLPDSGRRWPPSREPSCGGQPTEVEAFLLEAGCATGVRDVNKTGVCARP